MTHDADEFEVTADFVVLGASGEDATEYTGGYHVAYLVDVDGALFEFRGKCIHEVSDPATYRVSISSMESADILAQFKVTVDVAPHLLRMAHPMRLTMSMAEDIVRRWASESES